MQRFIRIVLWIIGISHSFVTITAMFWPEWFYTYIGPFPPLNAHYVSDVGAFNLPLGVGLIVAAQAPYRHRLVVGIAALGNLAHAFSHLRDGHLHVPPYMPLALGLGTQISTLVTGLLLLGIAIYLSRTAPYEQPTNTVNTKAR